MQKQLQTLATAYTKGDGFQFSRAANQLRDGLRGLSPKIYPAESQLRLEYFYNHFDGFYRAAWCYGVAFVLFAVAHLREQRRSCAKWIGVSLALARSDLSRDRNHDALPDRGPAAGDQHV